MSPEDVRDITFSLALMSKNAYDEAEVDAFLDRIEATLRGEDSLTADDVRDVAFTHPGIGRRGYTKDEVDEFLAQVAATLEVQ
jgi:DivIVA domain-containing protein